MSEHIFASEAVGSESHLIRYLPVMITRLLLSLKKANASQAYAWSLGELTDNTAAGSTEHPIRATTRDEIRLSRHSYEQA